MGYYEIRIKREAEKEIRSLPQPDIRRIIKKIQGLAENPRPLGCDKLKGEEGYRIRQGDYRIVYLINDSEKILRILRIGHRKEVYR